MFSAMMYIIIAGFIMYVAVCGIALLIETVTVVAEVVKFFKNNRALTITLEVIFLVCLIISGGGIVALYIVILHFIINIISKLRKQAIYKYYHSDKFNNIVYGTNTIDNIKQYKCKYEELSDKLNTKIKVGDTYIFNFEDANNSGYCKIYKCSLSILHGAEVEPEKYICKYFNIPIEFNTIDELFKTEELCMNIADLLQELEKLLIDVEQNVYKKTPIIYRGNKSKEIMYSTLGMKTDKISWKYFTKFIFEYTSPQGKSTKVIEYELAFDNIIKLSEYILDILKKRESSKGQRMLMTAKLRQEILERDDYTCQKCGNSTYKEENLLLEVDHIIPVSKGGKTVPENLQTLCWKCNRSKGNSM